VARTARRDVIGLLLEKQVTYTDTEADELIAQAKELAQQSGRTVRAEAELLLSRDTTTRLRELQNKVVAARELLAAIVVEVNDLQTETDDETAELATIVAMLAVACEPFSPSDTSISTSALFEPSMPSSTTVTAKPIATESADPPEP
jgi:hypothetical protein